MPLGRLISEASLPTPCHTILQSNIGKAPGNTAFSKESPLRKIGIDEPRRNAGRNPPSHWWVFVYWASTLPASAVSGACTWTPASHPMEPAMRRMLLAKLRGKTFEGWGGQGWGTFADTKPWSPQKGKPQGPVVLGMLVCTRGP